jgi:hypothetical protein
MSDSGLLTGGRYLPVSPLMKEASFEILKRLRLLHHSFTFALLV